MEGAYRGLRYIGAVETLPRSARARAALTGRAVLALAAALALGPFGAGCQRAGSQPVVAGPVVLIVVDTLRADRLGFHGYARATSPSLDAWAEGGTVFERAWATSPWTLPSMGSLLTGRWPVFHKAGIVTKREPRRGFAVLASERRGIVTLATRLRAAGWRTGAVVSNPYLGPQFGLDRGFDFYDAAKLEDERMRRADAGVDAALAWLDRQPDGRFFLLLHLYDPHLRYDAPPPQRGRFTREVLGSALTLPIEDVEALRARADTLGQADRAFVSAAYDEELAFVDAQLERFRHGLAERELLEPALVVLTSDHGEELFEHGGFEHGHALWQELLHVPLVVRGPGVRAGRSQLPVSLVDVMPTLCDALGLPVEDEALDGRSLWPLLTGADASLPDDRALVAEGTYYGSERKAILRWPHKLVFNPGNGLRRLIDLSEDPGEHREVTADRTPIADRLQRELERHIAAGAQGMPVLDAEIDDELRGQLEALGYAQ